MTVLEMKFNDLLQTPWIGKSYKMVCELIHNRQQFLTDNKATYAITMT